MTATSSFESSLALRASGVLAEFNRAGILSAADVHVALRLGRIGGETDEAVLLAAALVVRSTRHGSVVLDLATAEETTSPDVDDAEAPTVDVPLRGYLTGSIDAVLRVGSPARYVVVDYKTNRLGGYDEPLTAWHYRSAALETAMIEAHYPLQAVLYAVALHRYLRWRQPGYDPDVHLGGCLYLFLRGMSGPGVLDADGAAPGVFAWRPPSGLVTGLSDLLAGKP